MSNSQNEFGEILAAIDRSRELLESIKAGAIFLDEEMLNSLREDANKFVRLFPEMMEARGRAFLDHDYRRREEIESIIAGLQQQVDQIAALRIQDGGSSIN